jgi:hypothetical protein
MIKLGDKVTYTKEFMFGKVGEVTSKVVVIKGAFALLENGEEICVEVLRKTK